MQLARFPDLRVAALVLAAGRSTRMEGGNKLLAVLAGETIVARTVDAALASAARPVVVVVGHDRERVVAALAARPVAFADNPDYRAGIAASVAAGIAALPADTEAALVLLADMPRVGALHLERLIAAFAASGQVCVPTWQGRRGNPLLWPAALFPALRALSGDVGGRQLLARLSPPISEVEMPDDAVVTDIDTAADLVRETGPAVRSSPHR
jgi:molybdenum cofactor cytidylyltransferase